MGDGSHQGLPAEPDGEPLLARWFVLAMGVLSIAAIAVTVWTFTAFSDREPPPAATRRPPGTATVTHDRGQAVLSETTDTEEAVGCAEGVTLIGDQAARAAGRRALLATCQLLRTGDYPVASEGMKAWIRGDGLLRIATFELTGTESSARLEDDRLVIELSPRFQFQNAARGAPFVIHELVHMGSGTWPGAPVTATQEVAATRATHLACQSRFIQQDPPLGCIDAADIVADPDPVQAFIDAGYLR